MTDIQQARVWAEEVGRLGGLMPGPRVAVEVIQSLPDQVIDAEKVREIYDRYRASEITLHEAFRAAVALTTPPLPTLADMTAEEREACRWMQAKIHRSDDLEGVIFFLTDDRAKIMFRDGTFVIQDHEDVTPLPDLPRLEWPGSHADTITAESVEDVQAGRVADFEPALPRPEDVPAGEPWLILRNGHEWVGTRESRDGANWPWSLARLDGIKITSSKDLDITLVSRLVPEVKP